MMRLVFLAHFFPNKFKLFVGRHAARNLLQFESVAVHQKFVQALNEVPLAFGVKRHEECVLQALEQCVGGYLLPDPFLDFPVSRTWYHHFRSIGILRRLVLFLHNSFPPRGREDVHDKTTFIVFIPVFYLGVFEVVFSLEIPPVV